jgi:hypothetical protein
MIGMACVLRPGGVLATCRIRPGHPDEQSSQDRTLGCPAAEFRRAANDEHHDLIGWYQALKITDVRRGGAASLATMCWAAPSVYERRIVVYDIRTIFSFGSELGGACAFIMDLGSRI